MTIKRHWRYGKNEKNAHMNFQTSYLEFISGMMGIKDIEILSLDNEEFGGKIIDDAQKVF